jgi:hypothetical protein
MNGPQCKPNHSRRDTSGMAPNRDSPVRRMQLAALVSSSSLSVRFTFRLLPEPAKARADKALIRACIAGQTGDGHTSATIQPQTFSCSSIFWAWPISEADARGESVGSSMLDLLGGNILVDVFEITIALCSVWIIASEVLRRLLHK